MRREYRQSAKLALRSELMSGSGASGTEADRLPSRTVRHESALRGFYKRRHSSEMLPSS